MSTVGWTVIIIWKIFVDDKLVGWKSQIECARDMAEAIKPLIPITIWERWNKGSEDWSFNHISMDYSSIAYEPKPVDADQKKLWKGVKWKATKAHMDENHKVIHET